MNQSFSTVLFENARVYDGTSEALTEPMGVLVEGNHITRIAPSVTAPEGATVVDAGGRTLSPGFIDAHSHVMFQLSISEGARTDALYHAIQGAAMAKLYLSRGYTTIRDAAGNSFSLKLAIDRGITEGPRIYPSGPMFSQTSGHADLSGPAEPSRLVGGEQSQMAKMQHHIVVDGVPEVLRGVRHALGRGASQIKIAVGGGCGSEHDPLDVTEFTSEEIEAAVRAAADWNTYVTAHVYSPTGVRRAIAAGVRCIEHGNLLDEDTFRAMKEAGTWLSPQVIVYTFRPNGFTDEQAERHRQVFEGIDKMFTAAKAVGFDRIGFGSDIVTSPELLAQINEEFIHRTKWFTPAEILRQATSNNAQILAMSGPRNPYPGTLGVIEEGALADILLINGDPLTDLAVLTDPEKNLALIMKDGVIVKNTLDVNTPSALAWVVA